MNILKSEFYERPAYEVAPDLLGRRLVRRVNGVKVYYRILEVEAYDGIYDLACHASKGRTKRTEVMFGPPAVWYVYLIYGMYDMLNIVTGKDDYPAAVLIRGIEGFDGPGRLTRGISVDRSFNGLMSSPDNELWIEGSAEIVPGEFIIEAPRVGVEYAGEWASKPWRFMLRVA